MAERKCWLDIMLVIPSVTNQQFLVVICFGRFAVASSSSSTWVQARDVVCRNWITTCDATAGNYRGYLRQTISLRPSVYIEQLEWRGISPFEMFIRMNSKIYSKYFEWRNFRERRSTNNSPQDIDAPSSSFHSLHLASYVAVFLLG